MKRINKQERIIQLSKQGLKPKEIAEKANINIRYVYSIRSANKKAIKPLTAHERHLQKSLAEARGELYPIQAHIKKITTDMVNHPPHYTAGGIETIDFIEAKKLGYNLGNVVKYITRSDLKGDRLKDLEKAQWYLTREINNAKKGA